MKNTPRLNLKNFSNEFNLLLDIIRLENVDDIELGIEQIINTYTRVNWNEFMELVLHHRVFPVVVPKMLLFQKNGFFPGFVGELLNSHYKHNTFNMLYLKSIMNELSGIFQENNIPSMVLKGPVLAEDLYGDLSLRTCGDLDILVPISKLESVDKLLAQQGYKKDEYIQSVLNDWRWRHHHVTYFHSKTKVKVEVHWRLNPGPGKEPNFNFLWQRKRLSKIGEFPVYYLGKEDLFLFLVSHGARHGWSRLRWLIDIDRISKKNLNYNELSRILKKYNVHHIGEQALILTEELLGTSSISKVNFRKGKKRPRQLAQKAIFYLERLVNLHTDPVPIEVAKFHKRHLFSLMSINQKIYFILSFLFPYPEDAKTLPLPKSLHFLYFPLRPLLWIWRKTRKYALS